MLRKKIYIIKRNETVFKNDYIFSRVNLFYLFRKCTLFGGNENKAYMRGGWAMKNTRKKGQQNQNLVYC